MRDFIIREFDTMSQLWQDYADELHLMLGVRRMKKNEIELSLSTVGSVIKDLKELISMEGNNALDQQRVGRARKLVDYYHYLQEHLETRQIDGSRETAA